MIRVYEKFRHRECIVAKAPRGRETDQTTRHLGDQDDVVFSWRLEDRQLRVLGEEVTVPFIG